VRGSVAKSGLVGALKRVLVPNHELLGGRREKTHRVATTSMRNRLLVHRIHQSYQEGRGLRCKITLCWYGVA